MDFKKIKKAYAENNIVGARLRQARKTRKWSQRELAKRADFVESAISHFESGRRVPTLFNFIKLALALKFSTQFLSGIPGDSIWRDQ